MQSSARRGIQYPSLDRSDKPDIPAHVKNLIDALELDVASSQGLLASRAANPGFARQVYWGTDTHLLYYWDGSAWFTVGTSDVIAGSSINAKGDLIVGLANDTPGILGVGSNGFTLQADNGQAQGVKWARDAVIDLIAAKGDILAGTAADALARIAAGADGQALISDSAQAAGIKWGSPVLATVSSYLTGDVAMTNANQFYDGPSVSCAAGIWLLIAQATVTRGGSGGNVNMKLWDGTTVISASEGRSAGASGDPVTIQVFGIASPGSPTTYKISLAADQPTQTIKATPTTNNTGETNKTTVVLGVKIA